MKVAVAVQRKILELIYSIFKSDKPFKEVHIKPNARKNVEELQNI